MQTTSWNIAERFNKANMEEFHALNNAGRLVHIGYCMPTAQTGDFATLADALAWIAAGKNVYADVRNAELVAA